MMQAYKTQPAGAAAVGGAAPAPVAPVPAPVMAPSAGQSWAAGDQSRVNSAIDSLVTSGPNLLKMEQDNTQPPQQQQQGYEASYGYRNQVQTFTLTHSTETSSLGQAPSNPLFGAYANQRY